MPNKTQQEEINNRFDELRKQVAGHYNIALPPEVFFFLQSEINQARAGERKRVVKEIQLIADTVPPNLLLNEIVNKIY